MISEILQKMLNILKWAILPIRAPYQKALLEAESAQKIPENNTATLFERQFFKASWTIRLCRLFFVLGLICLFSVNHAQDIGPYLKTVGGVLTHSSSLMYLFVLWFNMDALEYSLKLNRLWRVYKKTIHELGIRHGIEESFNELSSLNMADPRVLIIIYAEFDRLKGVIRDNAPRSHQEDQEATSADTEEIEFNQQDAKRRASEILAICEEFGFERPSGARATSDTVGFPEVTRVAAALLSTPSVPA